MTISEALRIIEEEKRKAQKTLNALPPSGRRNATKLKELVMAYITVIVALEKLQAQVHCRDCKHWGTGVAGETDMVKCCVYGGYMVGNNGYCVYGERKEEKEHET